MARKEKKSEQIRCKSKFKALNCQSRFYTKDKRVKSCPNCKSIEYLNTKIGKRVESHLKKMIFEEQLRLTDLDGVTGLYKKLDSYSGYYANDGKLKSSLNLELSHLYPASKGGLLTPDNLVIAPKRINRELSNKLYPIGRYSKGERVSTPYKQWAIEEYDLAALIKKHKLPLRAGGSGKVKDFTSETYTENQLLISESKRLGYVLHRLGDDGWHDLMSGKLDEVGVNNPHYLTIELWESGCKDLSHFLLAVSEDYQEALTDSKKFKEYSISREDMQTKAKLYSLAHYNRLTSKVLANVA